MFCYSRTKSNAFCPHGSNLIVSKRFGFRLNQSKAEGFFVGFMMLKANPRSDMDCCASQQESEDQEVDILECENLNDEEGLCQSSSSSFGDSLCARDDDDDCCFEAQSMLSKDYPLPESFGDGTEILGLRKKKKKKKVTDEWRRFSQPLMWRCKWLELKVKELESQARGYDKEVQSYYGDDQTQRMSVFKRGRRRRVEETTDVSAYISNHNVFSYAGNHHNCIFSFVFHV